VRFFFIGTNRVQKNGCLQHLSAYCFTGTFWVLLSKIPLFSVLSGYFSMQKKANQRLNSRQTPKMYEYLPDFTRNV
jgi:hypothetical protein